MSRWAPDGIRSDDLARLLADLRDASARQLVLDLSAARAPSQSGVSALVRLIVEAQRLGRGVALVRCTAPVYRRLRESGVGAGIRHVLCIGAATGAARDQEGKSVELHLRSAPEMLHRVRAVARSLAAEAGFGPDDAALVQIAVSEATANAILHGSPQGARNHVRVTFHLDGRGLSVDVADQGPGFDPESLPPGSDPHLGLAMICRAMDEIEFYRDENGMLVRMVRHLPEASEKKG